MKLTLIIITPLSLLLVILLLSNQAAPIVYAQPTGWVELVGERTRTGKVFFDPSRPGVRALDVSVAKVHYDGPDWKDIDNALVPSLANVPTLGLVDLEMTTDDYEFYALQTLNTIPLWSYLNKSAPDTYITFMPQGIQWTNDLDQIDLISMPQSVIGAVTENRLHWEDAYGPGINLTLFAQPGRLAKVLTLENMPRVPAQYIIDGGNPALELQFIFGIPSGPNAPEIWVDGILWSQSAKTETVNVVDFKKNGETLFSFAEPRAFDSRFEIASASFVLTKQGPNLRVAIHIPLSFLENATYPVFIDPIVDEQVGASADDGLSLTGFFGDTASTITMGRSSGGVAIDAWFRFTTVNIAPGNTINSANFSGIPEVATHDGTGVRVNIYAEDHDNAAAPTDVPDHAAKVRTTAFTAWDDEDHTDEVEAVSPDITAVIQEIIDRPGWSANNAMQLLIDDDTSTTDFYYEFYAYDNTPAKAGELHIDYGWTNTAPNISNKISTETVNVNETYNRSFSATDPDTNQTLQWELDVTSAPFTVTVWNEGNRTTYVTATPDETGTFYVNVTVGDDATTGNETDYVNYTLIVRESALVIAETLLENALFFMVGFIPFLMAIGIGFWKESGPMLMIGALIGILLGLWVMASIYWVFGFSFVGISILFGYIGWVSTETGGVG